MSTGIENNLPNNEVLKNEMAWFQSIVNNRAPTNNELLEEKKSFWVGLFKQKTKLKQSDSDEILPVPNLPEDSFYSQIVSQYELVDAERFVIMLALATRIDNNILAPLKLYSENGHDVGGIRTTSSNLFLPTIQTALFLLSQNDLAFRFGYQSIFENENPLIKNSIIELVKTNDNEPYETNQIRLSNEYYQKITQGKVAEFAFSIDFPAQKLNSTLNWDEDLVLDNLTRNDLTKIENWLKARDELERNYGKIAAQKKGFKVLFFGKPGTGKTLTATLLCKKMDLPLYKISLSSVISKYIGETEKNLEKIFTQTANQRCALFIDEADSIVGKRTNINDAHDRYGNQDVAYLLQRLEDYPNLIIMATNMDKNIDDAFNRRITKVYFALPEKTEIAQLWKKNLAAAKLLWVIEDDEKKINQEHLDLLTQNGLTGSNITNIVHDILIKSIAQSIINKENENKSEIINDGEVKTLEIIKKEEEKTPEMKHAMLSTLYNQMLEEVSKNNN